jgi:hypothetical protein
LAGHHRHAHEPDSISNPLSVIEQFTYLLFARRLDELHTAREGTEPVSEEYSGCLAGCPGCTLPVISMTARSGRKLEARSYLAEWRSTINEECRKTGKSKTPFPDFLSSSFEIRKSGWQSCS